jgi:hypothetical protein
MTLRTKLPAVVLAAFVAGGASAQAADKVLVQTTFDSDLGGWTATVPAEVAWSAGGGNPGGRAVFTQSVSGPCSLIAPSAFLSGAVNYTALNGKGYISFQHEVVLEKGVSNVEHYTITMKGPGNEAVFTGGEPLASPTNKWVTVAAPLVRADWTITQGNWTSLLADVEDIEIVISLFGNEAVNEDVEAIDNIEVVQHGQGFSPK